MDEINQLSIVDSGIVVPCRSDETVYHALQKSGFAPIPRGCGGGGCGACKVQIRTGAYRIVQPMSREHVDQAEERYGVVLACCVVPESDLQIGLFPGSAGSPSDK